MKQRTHHGCDGPRAVLGVDRAAACVSAAAADGCIEIEVAVANDKLAAKLADAAAAPLGAVRVEKAARHHERARALLVDRATAFCAVIDFDGPIEAVVLV